MISDELLHTFQDAATRAFGFLVEEHGFGPAVLEVRADIPFAYVTFPAKALAIECVLDNRDEDIDCKVVRLHDGTKPAAYDYDERGVLVRDGVFHLLTRRGLWENPFHHVGHLPFNERIPITLDDFAQMLKMHGRDILEDSPTALDS